MLHLTNFPLLSCSSKSLSPVLSNAMPFSTNNILNVLFYYYIYLVNNIVFKVFIIVVIYSFIILTLNDNVLYCMDDINEGTSSPESGVESFSKKRKYITSDSSNVLGSVDSSILASESSKNTIVADNQPNIDSASAVESSKGVNLNFSILADFKDSFKIVGLGAAATGIGIGASKILKTLPPQTRAGTTIAVSSLIASYLSVRNYLNILYGKDANIVETSSNSTISANIPVKNIPKYEIDTNIKVGDYSINAKIENDELTLNRIPSTTSASNSNVDNLSIIENTSTSNISNEEYYKISDSYNINSVLECGDLLNMSHYNVYYKLELVLLFVLFLSLYAVFGLTIISVINKYGTTLDNYFKNKYILMYINLNRKYLNILFWFWLIFLYFSIALAMVITYALIDTFDMYFIHNKEVISNSLLVFGSYKSLINNKNDKNKINVNTSL